MNGAWSEFEQYCRVEKVLAEDLLQLYMDNLKSGTYYRIELRAHNAMGYSQTRALKLKTARGESDSDNYESVPFEASFAFSSSSSVVGHARTVAALIVPLAMLLIGNVVCRR